MYLAYFQLSDYNYSAMPNLLTKKVSGIKKKLFLHIELLLVCTD